MGTPPRPYAEAYSRDYSASSSDLIVPQRPYAANVQRNHTHSIGVVEFWVNGQRGISLRDAQARVFSGLAQADDRLLEGFGTKVTYRLEVRIANAHLRAAN